MNETEIDRIAAAVNILRPDWPTASLRTLLGRNELRNRPRRDVAVALAWVACESESKTPARVLEQGPWWRAVVTEGASFTPAHLRTPACIHCGFEKAECERRWGTDHTYEGPEDWMRRRPKCGPEQAAEIVRALKDEARHATKADAVAPTKEDA